MGDDIQIVYYKTLQLMTAGVVPAATKTVCEVVWIQILDGGCRGFAHDRILVHKITQSVSSVTIGVMEFRRQKLEALKHWRPWRIFRCESRFFQRPFHLQRSLI